MSGLETDVNIILTAEDKASSTVQDAAKRINTSYREMNNQQRAVERSFTLQHQSLTQTMKVMQSVGTVVNRAIGIYNSYTLTQIRLADANSRATDSTTSLSEAIVRYGEGSPEAEKAAENQRKALEDLKQAQDAAAIGYTLMATSIIADSTRIITSVIPKLKALQISLGGITGTKQSVSSGSKSPVGSLSGSTGTRGTFGSGPPGGFGGIGLIGPVALGVGALEFGLGMAGIEKQSGSVPKTSFQTLNDLQASLDKKQVIQNFYFNGIVNDDIPGKVAEEAKRSATYSE